MANMSKKSLDKAREIRAQVIKALNNLSSERSEPRYLLVEERDLRLLAESLEYTAGAKRLAAIQEAVLEDKAYVEQLIKESDSMSLEEKETLMKELSKLRKAITQQHKGASK